jgi:hypothetical protein
MPEPPRIPAEDATELTIRLTKAELADLREVARAQRDQFFIWLQSWRSPAELEERGDAIAEILGQGLGVAVYDNGDEITTIDLTTSGLQHLHPLVLPPTHE